ncbi:MAG: hypothetical protein LBS62_05165 [Clostridiales bacterium]|jgi:acyl-ACP thioesterase|nr:hypothetical protein [Clostridiales bacterium]
MFECKQTIGYQGILPDLRVSFPEFMKYIVEASMLHCESTPYTLRWYMERGQAFVLTGWQLRVFSYPLWNDTITIRTAPTEFKGVLASRAFEVLSAAGDTLALANSSWIYLDMSTRKPVKPGAEHAAAFGPPVRPRLPADLKLPDHTGWVKLRETSFRVPRSAIDSNSHANNCSYIEWATDNLPEGICESYSLREMRTRYRKECRLGDAVTVEALGRAGEAPGDFVCLVRGAADARILTEIWMRWE